VTITGAAKLMNVSYPTAQKYVERLEEDGILDEVTGKARYRTYIAREILALLEDQDTSSPIEP
jgi:Fic family protein